MAFWLEGGPQASRSWRTSGLQRLEPPKGIVSPAAPRNHLPTPHLPPPASPACAPSPPTRPLSARTTARLQLLGQPSTFKSMLVMLPRPQGCYHSPKGRTGLRLSVTDGLGGAGRGPAAARGSGKLAVGSGTGQARPGVHVLTAPAQVVSLWSIPSWPMLVPLSLSF